MKELTSYNRAVQYLTKVFKLVNAEFFNSELEMPTITIQSTTEAYGHVTSGRIWKTEQGYLRELNISADYLDRSVENIVATLIHEGCHLYAMQNGIRDTSNRGIYHNHRFKELAESRGLKISKHQRYGWTITEPTERIYQFCEKYSLGNIQISRKNQLSFTDKGNDNSAFNKKKSSYQRWICPCCQTIIRSTKNINIICGDCGKQFVHEEKQSG